MGKDLLSQQRFLMDGHEITTDLHAVEAALQIEDRDGTTFGTSGVRDMLAGLKRHSFSYSGRWQAGTAPLLIDDVLFARFNTTNIVVSYGPTTGAEGATAFTTRLLGGSYVPFDSGAVGEVHNFSFLGQSKGDPLVKGTNIHAGAETATGNGTGYTIGAASATQTLYGGLHLHSVTGAGTFDCLVQSDTSGFPSPTTKLTFTQLTAIGSNWQSLAGANTDPDYRVSFTISGFTSLTFDVVIGLWP